ncbi:MAG: beta-ketoacyl synthase chain length factor [Tannerella sp.]|jgi:3-oxoacyl-(acyl-carrier-protein) synthase|nr:beta-ketoacyl synthase chain length factor [Tannerella sp.]
MSIYIQSATQISAQKPLCDDWFDTPLFYTEPCVRSVDPNFTDYLSPIQSRRMGKLLKRVIVTARNTLQRASLEMPDAIISGTGLGCIDNTEKFIYSIMENKEQFLQPTFFMQSTHNILSSLIAIELKCHGYNNTFVHRGTSFENALLDACLQFRNNRIETALLGGYDELTDDYYIFFKRLGIFEFENDPYSPKHHCFAGEAAVSMLLASEKKENALCEVSGVDTLFMPSQAQLKGALDNLLATAGCTLSDVDAVMVGLNTNRVNDEVYHQAIDRLFAGKPILQYKHLFGQSFTSPALATYAAATCLHKNLVPAHLLVNGEEALQGVKRILLYNHYNNKSHSLILLSQC